MTINHFLVVKFFIYLLIAYPLVSCKAKELHRYNFSQKTMGTKASLIFYASITPLQAKKISKKAFARLEKIEQTFSTYLPHSELSKVNKTAMDSPIKISHNMLSLIKQSQKISQLTNGYFDITLSSKTKKNGFQHIKIDDKKNTVFFQKNLLLDFGGIVKGYASDEVIKILKKHKIYRICVDIGGEISLGDPPPQKQGWRIWLTNSKLQKQGFIFLKNCSLSTSGDFYHRQISTKSHIYTPSGFSKLNDTVSVISPTTIEADALATAFKSMGLKQTKLFFKSDKLMDITVFFIDEQNKIYQFGKKIIFEQKTK